MALDSVRRRHVLSTEANQVFLGSVKPASGRNGNSRMVLVSRTLVRQKAAAVTPFN